MKLEQHTKSTCEFLCDFAQGYITCEQCSVLLHRYLYMTMLREPVTRYISEWKHTSLLWSWFPNLMCGGRRATRQEMPICFPGKLQVSQSVSSVHEAMQVQGVAQFFFY